MNRAKLRTAFRRAAAAAAGFFWPVPCAACGNVDSLDGRGFCPSCAAALRPWHNDPGAAVRHAVLYDGPGGAAVRRLKYGRRTAVARPLAALLAAEARSPDFPAFDLVVPVPLHWRRELARGFNQSVLLAVHCARMTGRPAAPDALARVRPTAAQAGLDETDRRENVRGAFAVRRPAAVRGRRILLVDDVHTTGATAGEAARALRRAGAAAVTILTVAKS